MATSAAFASNDTAKLAKANTKPPANINRILDIGPSVWLKTYTENWPKPNLLMPIDNPFSLYRKLSLKPAKLVEISRVMAIFAARRGRTQLEAHVGRRTTPDVLNAR
jgi:hypothetical protein